MPSGKCGGDELCTGPHHPDYAECGKEILCEPSKSYKKENTICLLDGFKNSNEENYF